MRLQSMISNMALIIESEMFRGPSRAEANDETGADQLHIARRRAPMSTGAAGRDGIASAAPADAPRPGDSPTGGLGQSRLHPRRTHRRRQPAGTLETRSGPAARVGRRVSRAASAARAASISMVKMVETVHPHESRPEAEKPGRFGPIGPCRNQRAKSFDPKCYVLQRVTRHDGGPSRDLGDDDDRDRTSRVGCRLGIHGWNG